MPLSPSNISFVFLEPKACGRPEQPPNSTMTVDNFNVGAIIEYNCDEGHLLVGPTTRICLPTGFYNEFPPVCKSKFIFQEKKKIILGLLPIRKLKNYTYHISYYST